MFDIERERIKLFAKVWRRFRHRCNLGGDMAAYSKFYEDLVVKYYVENVKSGRPGFYRYTRFGLVLAPVLLVAWLANWLGGHPVRALVSFVAFVLVAWSFVTRIASTHDVFEEVEKKAAKETQARIESDERIRQAERPSIEGDW